MPKLKPGESCLYIPVPRELRDAIKRTAQEQGRPMQWWIAYALKRAIAENLDTNEGLQ